MFQKIIVALVFCFFIANLSFADMLEIGKGTLKLGAILQPTFSWTQAEGSPETAFTMKRARFLFSGTIIPDKVKYFIQTEAVSSPYLLDTKLQFYYIPKTEIAFGRFLPNFTYYMPMNVGKLEMINYPLMTTKYAVWRQVGIQSTTTTKYVDINLGIFNGYPSNNWTDNNDGKDVLLRATIKPVKQVQFFGYGWLGNALFAADADLANQRYGFGISAEPTLPNSKMALVFRGEYLYASDDTATNSKIKGNGYYIHVGFKPRPEVELLVRYDGYDPNTDVGANKLSWITGGINYYVSSTNVMFYLNYIHKKTEVAAGLKDPKDDELILQAQIAF